MNLSVCDPEVRALVVGTGEALGVYPFRCSPPTFDLAPGAYSRRYRLYKRRRGVGEATGGAIVWGAWLEQTLDRSALGGGCRPGRTLMGPVKGTKPCEREHEDKQE